MNDELYENYEKQFQVTQGALNQFHKEFKELQKHVAGINRAVGREQQRLQRQSRKFREQKAELETQAVELNEMNETEETMNG